MSIIIICQSIVIIILLRKIRNHGTYRFVDIAKYLRIKIYLLYSVSTEKDRVEVEKTCDNSAYGMVSADADHLYDVIEIQQSRSPDASSSN